MRIINDGEFGALIAHASYVYIYVILAIFTILQDVPMVAVDSVGGVGHHSMLRE